MDLSSIILKVELIIWKQSLLFNQHPKTKPLLDWLPFASLWNMDHVILPMPMDNMFRLFNTEDGFNHLIAELLISSKFLKGFSTKNSNPLRQKPSHCSIKRQGHWPVSETASTCQWFTFVDCFLLFRYFQLSFVKKKISLIRFVIVQVLILGKKVG